MHPCTVPHSTGRAAHELAQPLSRMRNLEAREAVSLPIEYDHLVLTGRQIDAHEDVVQRVVPLILSHAPPCHGDYAEMG